MKCICTILYEMYFNRLTLEDFDFVFFGIHYFLSRSIFCHVPFGLLMASCVFGLFVGVWFVCGRLVCLWHHVWQYDRTAESVVVNAKGRMIKVSV